MRAGLTAVFLDQGFMQSKDFRHTPSTCLCALRRATAAHHQAIESVIRLDGEWGMPHYVRVLLGFHHYLSAWEPAVARVLPAHLRDGFMARSRLPLLLADLRELDVPLWAVHDTPAEASDHAAPRAAPRLPKLPSVAAAMGSVYVLEGSALGGQLIARRLLVRHGRAADRGGAYFTGWGARTGAMWLAFQEMLAQEVGDEALSIHAACRAAVETFDGLAHSFEVTLHDHAPIS
jgi:heme oxygenase